MLFRVRSMLLGMLMALGVLLTTYFSVLVSYEPLPWSIVMVVVGMFVTTLSVFICGMTMLSEREFARVLHELQRSVLQLSTLSKSYEEENKLLQVLVDQKLRANDDSVRLLGQRVNLLEDTFALTQSSGEIVRESGIHELEKMRSLKSSSFQVSEMEELLEMQRVNIQSIEELRRHVRTLFMMLARRKKLKRARRILT